MHRNQGRRLSALGFLGIALLLISAPSASAVVTSSVTNGFLSVQSNADDAIEVTCETGNLKVNGADPGNGVVACSLIHGISVTGGPGANTIDLSGVTAADFPNLFVGIFGNAGDDSIIGSEFPEFLDGGSGSDTIDGGGAVDQLRFSGSLAADTIVATVGTGSLTAGGETDTYTGIESFSLSGLAGNDTLAGASGDDSLQGGDGNDTLTGAGGNDSLDGATGQDILDAGDGNDFLTGDPFSGQEATDTLSGGVGTDSMSFAATLGDDQLSATSPDGSLTAGGLTDTYTGIERFSLSGLTGNDTLAGAGGDDFLQGGDGNDTLTGVGGPDFLDGGTGQDSLNGGDGNDYLSADAFGGQEAPDTLSGGADLDTLSFAATVGDDQVSATSPDGSLTAGGLTDTYTGIERFSLSGLAGNDTLTGASGDDSLDGGSGNDVLSGGPGNDFLSGENPTEAPPNDDQLDGGTGNDFLLPGQGNDIVKGGADHDMIRDDLFGVENDNWDGQAGPDSYVAAFGTGAIAKTMIVADPGPAADTDDLAVADCTGVTKTSTELRKGAEVITFTGIEVKPCPFAPPPPPPPEPPPPTPPPPSPPPPAPPPPAPPPAAPPPPPATQLRCVVPNVKGKTLARARRLLVSKRCALGRVTKTYSQKVKKGRVISQRPTAGRRLPGGTKVHVKVSRGRRPPT